MNGEPARRHSSSSSKHLNGILPNVHGVPQPVESNMRADRSLSNGEIKVNGTGDAFATPAFKDPFKQGPPDLFHVVYQIEPLGVLFTRVAQECFNALNTHMEAMMDPSKLDVPPKVALGDPAVLSAWRKQMWLEFANEQRERFIKLYVLLKWSTRANDISRLIDLRYWVVQQVECFDKIEGFVAEMKRDLQRNKIPSPDIETALEILSTGSSSRLPDFNYVPRKPPTPQKLLATLRNLNAILHIRLNLYEDLPLHFRNFTIANGRATFVVPSEFEVDVSVADEDPTFPIFFIDFRFCFTPRTEIPTGPFLDQLELRVNHALATQGLAGCFDLLHDFTLTHKINILRRQAIDLNRSSYAGTLRIDQVHRSLAVQYWKDRPGHKSWFEIGIASGKTFGTKQPLGGPKPSHLCLRMFRDGKEVKDVDVHIDLDELNLEAVLTAVLSLHVSDILRRIETAYNTLLDPNDKLKKPTLHISSTEPSECVLTIPRSSSTSSSGSSSVLIEPISGSFVLQPPGPLATRWEERLNSLEKPSEEAATRLQQWQAAELQAEVDKSAAQADLVNLREIQLDTSSVKRSFGSTTIRLSFFRGRKWQSTWCLVASMSPTKINWWIADVQRTSLNSHYLRSYEQLPLNEELGRMWDSQPRRFLSLLENFAVWRISLTSVTRQLSAIGCEYKLGDKSASQSYHKRTMMTMSLKSILKSGRESGWGSDSVVVMFAGFEDVTPANIRYVLRGKLQPSDSLQLLQNLKTPVMSVDNTGTFALLVTCPLGSSKLVSEMTSRLRSLERLHAIIVNLKERKYKCSLNSPNDITFEYSSEGTTTADTSGSSTQVGDVKLRANIAFGGDRTSELTLYPPSNPHHRLIKELNHYLQSKASTSTEHLSHFFHALQLSLPVLKAFEEMEKRDTTGNVVRVHARELLVYHIRLAMSRVHFELRACEKRGQDYWVLRMTREDAHLPAPFKQALKNFFDNSQRATPSLLYLGSGFAAKVDAIHDALLRLYETAKDHMAVLSPPGGPQKSQLGPSPTQSQAQSQPQSSGNMAPPMARNASQQANGRPQGAQRPGQPPNKTPTLQQQSKKPGVKQEDRNVIELD